MDSSIATPPPGVITPISDTTAPDASAPPAGTVTPTLATPDTIQQEAPYDADGIVRQLQTLPPDEALDKAVSINKGDLRWPLEYFKGVSPDVAAQVQQLARNNGISYPVANASKDELELADQAQQIYKSLSATNSDGTPVYPSVIKHLTGDPANLAASKDDVANLMALEEAAKGQSQAGEGGFHTEARAFLSPLVNLAGALTRSPAATYGFLAGVINRYAAAEDAGTTGQPAHADASTDLPAPSAGFSNAWGLASTIQDYAKHMAPAALDNQSFIGDIKQGNVAGAGEIATQSLATIVPLIAAAAFGQPEAGLTAQAASSQGESFGEGLDEGKSPEMAADQGAVSGAANYLLPKYLGNIPFLKSIIESAQGAKAVPVGGTLPELARRAGILALTGAARGGATQAALQASQDVGDYATGNPNALDDEKTKLLNTALIGAVGEGFMGGVSPFALHSLATSRLQQMSAEDFDNLSKAAAGTKMAERDPEGMGDFINNTLLLHNEPTDFYVPADKVLTHFQDDPQGLQKFTEDMGLQPGDVQDAAAGGSDIQINKGDYISKGYKGSPLDAAIQQDIRFIPGGPNSVEVEAETNRLAETAGVMSQEVARLSAPDQDDNLAAHLSVLRDKLTAPKSEGGAGYTGEAADAHLALLTAGISNLARQRGETPAQAFQRIGLTIDTGSKVIENQDGTKDVVKQSVRSQGARGALVHPERAYVTLADGSKYSYGKGAATIHLFESADMSTFAHEAGHLFLNEIKRMIAEGKANDQTINDFYALNEWAKGLADPEEAIVKGFEQYLREGKAPDPKLAGAFDRFRQWMLNIYRSVLALGRPINDTVRGIFNRMLAADEDISNAKEYYSQKDELIDHLGATEKQKSELLEKKGKADVAANDAQVKKYLKAFYEVKGKDVFKRQATKNVEAQPVYKILVESKDFGGISKESLSSHAAKGQGEELLAKYPKLFKEGATTSLDTLAAIHGYNSPEDLLDALQAAPAKAEAVAAESQRLQDVEETNIRNDLLNRGATRADGPTHTDASLAYMIAETKLMANKLGAAQAKAAKQLNAQSFKAAVKQWLGGRPVREAVRFDLFAKSEARLGRDVITAARKGDWAAAYAARDKQLLQHALVHESIKLREEKNAIEQRYRTTELESALKNVEDSYVDPIREILSTYGISARKPANPVDLKTVELLDPTLAAQLPDWLIAKEMPAQRVDAAGKTGTPYLELPFSQFVELDRAVGALMSVGSAEMKSNIAGEKARLDDYGASMVALMSGLKDLMVPSKASNNIGEATGRMLFNLKDWLNCTQTMMVYMAKHMDDFREQRGEVAGPAERLVRGTYAAEINQRDMLKTVLAMAQPHWDTLGDAAKRIEKELFNGRKSFDIDGLPLGDKNAPAGSVARRLYAAGESRWDSGKLIGALLNMGNRGNRAALMNGYGFTEDNLAQIAKMFSPSELKAVQGIWDATNTLWPKLDETQFHLYNRHAEKVNPDALSLVANDGSKVSLEGGYYPLVFDRRVVKYENDKDSNITEAELTKDYNIALFTPASGFTIRRRGGVMPPLLSPKVWDRHVTQVARFIHFAPIIRDLNRITQQEGVRGAVEAKFGEGQYRMMRHWLQDLARPQLNEVRGSQKGVDAIADRMQERAANSLIGAKFSTGIVQRAGIANIAQRIGWNYYLKGVTACGWKGSATAIFGIPNTDIHKEVLDQSKTHGDGVMTDREHGGQVSRELGESTGNLTPDRTARFSIGGMKFSMHDVIAFGHIWLNMNDRAVNVPGWVGAKMLYMDTMADKHSDMKDLLASACKYADSVIVDSQPTGIKAERSEFLRSPGWLRFFKMFMAYSSKFFNIAKYNWNAVQSGAMPWKTYVSHVINEILLEPTSRYLVRAMLGSFGLSAGGAAFSVINNLLSTVPNAGNTAEGLEKKKGLVDSLLDIPIMDLPKKLDHLRADSIKAFEGTGDFGEAFWDLARLVAAWHNIPYLNVVEEMKQDYAKITGNTHLQKHYK